MMKNMKQILRLVRFAQKDKVKNRLTESIMMKLLCKLQELDLLEKSVSKTDFRQIYEDVTGYAYCCYTAYYTAGVLGWIITDSEGIDDLKY